MRFAYKNQEGDILGYVVRLEEVGDDGKPNGNKITPTLTYWHGSNGRSSFNCWKWKGLADDSLADGSLADGAQKGGASSVNSEKVGRPLYGLEQFSRRSTPSRRSTSSQSLTPSHSMAPGQGLVGGQGLVPDQSTAAPILIVEGEKTADAAKEIFKDHIVLTWPGGSGGVSKANWSPVIDYIKQAKELDPKNVPTITIWPDHDQAGLKAAERVALVLCQKSSRADGNQADGKELESEAAKTTESNTSQTNTSDTNKNDREVQNTLTEQYITEQDIKVVDLKPAKYSQLLPHKWDLADELPKELAQDMAEELANKDVTKNLDSQV
ncbi:MAG: hypothetical protein JKY88_02010, partial [Pseudomonadales bacterium]|nr:hypothetical protein [Pseudomonadales bacterium]